MTTLYGIRNCDTVKKARRWLDEHGVAYEFHDYKTQGVEAERLAGWADAVGWERLLNRSGTTFRKLPDDSRADVDRAKALRLMGEHTSVIRRPVVEHDGAILIGFDAERYAETWPGA